MQNSIVQFPEHTRKKQTVLPSDSELEPIGYYGGWTQRVDERGSNSDED